MQTFSPQAKSFAILFFLAVFGTFLCLSLWSDMLNLPQTYDNQLPTPRQAQAATDASPTITVDTSTWKTYTNQKYHFSFLYKPGWNILPATQKNGYTILQVDPGKTRYNIKIYISPKDFYIMGGLPATTGTIGGQPALNVGDALFGVTANNLYYTFDVGLSMSLVPEFGALVHSVKFTN